MPELSVIMTIYNSERFLREAIESVLCQTLRSFEFIIFDDGSTDTSAAIVESYSDSRIRIFRSPHIGRAAALNKAIAHAKNDLLAFMDSDDISVKNRFEEQIKFLSENAAIGVVGCWLDLIDENGKYIGTRIFPKNHQQIENEITPLTSIILPASIIKKTLIDKVNGFDQSLITSIDYDLFLRLLPITSFHNIQLPLLKYRKHSRSITSFKIQSQDKTNLIKARKYLESKINNGLARKGRASIFSRIGMCEFYLGSMHEANKFLFKAILLGDFRLINLRFFFHSLLGNTLITIYRKQKQRIISFTGRK